MRAVVVTPTSIELKDVADLRAVIGGYLESLSVGENFICFIDEDGKVKGLPVNEYATSLIVAMLHVRGRCLLPGDYIVGTAVFVGMSGENEGDIPESVIDEYFPELK